MKNIFHAVMLWGCTIAFIAQPFAQDIAAPKVEVIGKAAIEEGQFVKGDYTFERNGASNSPFIREVMPYRPWLNNDYAQIGLKATINSHFSAVVSPQIKLWTDSWDWTSMGQNGAASNPFIQHMTISLADAEGIVHFGSDDAIAFTAAAGVFPFKYDYDVKNLGEYLFRTGEHPAYIQTSFDNAFATLTGLRINAQMYKSLSLDVLLTQETQIIPLNDWSVSVLAGYSLPKLLDVGAGIMFDRLLPTGPIQGEQPVDSVVRNTYRNTYLTNKGVIDTLSWGRTKVMVRASFDPKGFFSSGLSNIFGREDGKIYAEASILGINNFNAYKKSVVNGDTTLVIDDSMNFYSDIQQRIPVMVGFNIPTCSPLLTKVIGFSLLDYLSVEMEYFKWPYSPSLYEYESQLFTLPRPIIPVTNTASATPILYTNQDNWKWSINFRKTIMGNLSIIGQLSKDHTRHDAFYSAFADPEEVFIQPGQWGWWVKLQYNL